MIQTRISLLRNKFFFLLGIIIILSIFFIAITNFQTHENDLQQKIEKLEIQNEAIGKQVEVEKEQQHAERQLYERTKKELNQKLREQKEIHEKELREAQLRFNSLQQQYKILTTKHNDLEQDCMQKKKDLSTENNDLKRKLDEVKAQYSKTQTSKDNDNAMWKVKYENVLNEKEKLQKILDDNGNNKRNDEEEHQQYLQYKYRNYQLEQEIKDLKTKLHIPIDSNNNNEQQHRVSESSKNNNIDKSFQEQIPVSDDHYKIPINVRNRSSMKVMASTLLSTNNNKESKISNGIINSVENFQIIADNQNNVLQQPVLGKSSSTSTTTTPTSVIKKENLALPKSKSSPVATTTKSSKKLPKFVLPIPPDIKNDDSNNQRESNKEEKKMALDETLNKPQNEEINEMENGAHEINDNDFNDFNIEEKNQRNHFDNFEQDKNIVNNAAEEFDAHKSGDKKNLGNDEMDLEIINRPPVNMKDKLKDEIANDHGKEEAYLDLHIEQQEDDLDIGEYDDPKAIKQGLAERN
ncbi:hypothetical protein PVAND_011156 [Polypedilum vanderplanki]|uniref:Uncharacterized protein n=1 Tax=Polypedilum vanderplanki TaxID=319348 RepID=A0A9J6CJ41_POLVA|nr:hypothetical protein PVAND_011156 [Polypedilum vanderplanki]